MSLKNKLKSKISGCKKQCLTIWRWYNMITIIRPAYYAIDRVAEYCGLSTDDKSTIDAHNADEFYEIDTGTRYRYDAVSAAWIKQSVGGGG